MAVLRTCIDRELADGYLMPTIRMYDKAGNYTGQSVSYIWNNMSRECHHEFRANDETCGNCKWRMI